MVPSHASVRLGHGYHPLRVKRVVPETADTRSFVLDVPEHLHDAFRYRAGQFCTFRVVIDGEPHLRCYSMSSAPEADENLTVTVKRVPGGQVSNWFNDEVAEGDVLEASRPAGVFCVREALGQRPVVAFCGGSGVTPVMSIAKTVLATTRRPVHILYANRDRDSVIFGAALEALRHRHSGRLHLRLHFDTDAGYLDREAIAALATGHLDGDFYICGPGPFMDLAESTLLGVGVHQERILIERFAVAGAGATTAPTPADPPDGEPTETVEVTLAGQRTTIAYRPGDTVLETARRGGLQPPFSCEAGNCASCMAIVHEGSATMRTNNALTDEEVAEGWILTCQALPRGRVVRVEYEAL